MKSWSAATLVSLVFLAVAAGRADAAVRACDSIHAVQIALEEGLGDCDTTVMTVLQRKASGGPGAPFADPSWHADCLNRTANGCATQHAAHPERTVRANRGDLVLVFPDTTERCTDGTRPAYYFSPGSGAGAHRWIVYLNGNSGECGALLDRAAGVILPIGEQCFAAFASGHGDSGFLLRAAKNADGILSDAPSNPFSTWNRVHIPSCSNDQYQGQRIHQGVLVTTIGPDIYTADVFSRGHVIVKEVLDDLARDHGLADADTLVLHGVSGGAGGLIPTLDALAAHARTLLADSEAKVVGLIDSRGAEPGIDNSEARFDDATLACSSVFAADCAGLGFDQPPQGTDLSGFAFDRSAYLPWSPSHTTRGSIYEKFRSWHSVIDADCEAVHGPTAPECLDVDHVLFNHAATPVFVAASISDANQWNNAIEFLAETQPDTSWQALDCGAAPGRQYIAHTRNQLVSYLKDRDNPCGGADGDAHGSGPIGVWAPQIWEHVLAHDSCRFGRLTVGGVTLASAFSRWLDGHPVRLIDGYRGSVTGSECGATAPACP